MNKALVLGAGFNALSLIRTLGSAGVDVVHLSHKPFDFARHSRFVYDWHKVPSPVTDGPSLLNYLMNHSRIAKASLLIGSDDPSVIFISKNRNILSNRYIPAHESWDVIQPIISKDLLYKKAKDLQVPVPKVIIPTKGDSLSRVAASMVFPCIVKPYQSTRFSAIYGKKVLVANDPDELLRMLMDANRNGVDVMISEVISGSDERLCHYRSYIDSKGDILAEMFTRKVRQHPPSFGMACVAKTIPAIPEVRMLSRRLLKNMSFKGESSVEFKLDPNDGQYKLMEINARPVLPEEHFAAAGINFPFLAYRDLVENIRESYEKYELDLYWINNFTDTMEFIKSLLKNSGDINFSRFIEPYRNRHLVCVPLFDDPKPFIAAFYETCYRLFTKIIQRLKFSNH